MRILFWGTSDFAVPGLRALIGEGHEVVGVVTQPDRPAGRGRALRSSPVKELALEEAIPVFQPERARGADVMARLREFNPEISVVIAYGQILKPDVLDLPPLGSINLHASLLPELRGAAPINWAIIRGHEQTGVSIIRMNERMDAGAIILQIHEPILEDERASDLWARLSEIGAAALVEALALIEAGLHEERPQDDAKASLAPRIEREDARIDWKKSATELHRWIRGMDSVPGAWSQLNDQEVKLFRPRITEDHSPKSEPGTVVEVHEHDESDGFLVACGVGALWIREVTPPGKRRMTAGAWARGRGIQVGDHFV
ncbi:MAG: methionyl-tRNA formyltransferase [Gemmatimonadota bacterium]